MTWEVGVAAGGGGEGKSALLEGSLVLGEVFPAFMVISKSHSVLEGSNLL